ncbi:hypothetical protein H4219_004805 [Mycoemilia scoparia]|uniref:Cytochrome c-type biogenesis protein H TPR domain-containing protein n=1 Tax=Mycoemilia scoparia TaxID=417184 RepID=A0A9W7ZX27_9FUNG|nr:hypothetical protein H4219_004805 [Mycoemilia scoparia]
MTSQDIRSTEEIDLILGQVPDLPTSNLVKDLASGEYKNVLTSPQAQALFGTPETIAEEDQISDPKDLPKYIETRVQNYLTQNDTGKFDILIIGIACLQSFVQTNWTGPVLDFEPAFMLPHKIWHTRPSPTSQTTQYSSGTSSNTTKATTPSTVKSLDPESLKLHKLLLTKLSIDGEEVYRLTPRLLYLYLARKLLVDLNSFIVEIISKDEDEKSEKPIPFNQSDSALWWAIRCIRIQQEIQENPTSTALDQIMRLFGYLEKIDFNNCLSTQNADSSDTKYLKKVRQLMARFYLEKGMIYHTYGMNRDGHDLFKKAQEISGLKWRLTGAKGRRTRFQTFDITQLVLVAENEDDQDDEDKTNSKANNNDMEVDNSENPNNDSAAGSPSTENGPGASSDGPKTERIKIKGRPDTLLLNDDTLLENIKFTDPTNASEVDPTKQKSLNVFDQSLLLAFCLHVKNENPLHGLTSEEMMPYVTRVLANPNNWMVHTMALLLRSRLESNKSRTVERSTLQMQTLVDQAMQSQKDDANIVERMAFFYGLRIPSLWEMERELAERFMGLGILRSALDIYERLEMWDETVTCYQLLEQRDVAKQLVEKQLEIDGNDGLGAPKLWSLLGDITGNPDLWQKAWDVSGGRYSRAMRSLGSYQFKHQEYAKAVESLQKALTLNTLFDNAWYMLGCAAMQIEDWETATSAFQRTVQLDYENGEAWNNMASIYMRMENKKNEAWYALREALKSKPDDWRIWSNYLINSMALGKFSTAIYAMTRIIELRADKDGAKCVDVEVLRIIVNAIIRGQVDSLVEPSRMQTQDDKAAFKRKKEKLVEALEVLLTQTIGERITAAPEIWRLTADYWFWKGDFRKCLECYNKSYRYISAMPQVAYEPKVFEDAVNAVLELVDMYENLGPKSQSPENGDGEPELVCKGWERQAKMALRGLIGKTKASFEGTADHKRLQTALDQLSSN